MKQQLIGTLLLLLVIGHEASNVRRAVLTAKQTRAAIRTGQKHKEQLLAKAKNINDLKEIDLPLIIDILLGDACVVVSPTLAAKLDRIYEKGMAALESAGGSESRGSEAEEEADAGGGSGFLEKHGKVHQTHHAKLHQTHHAVSHHHGKAKIAVIDDIIAVLSVISVGLSIFNGIKTFLNGGISAEKREAFEAWLGTGETALSTSQTKLRQFQKWFDEHGASSKDEDIRADLAALKGAVEALSDKVGVIKHWMQKAVDESEWEYKTSTNVIFGILTAGIWNVVDKTTQRVNINGHQNRAFCAGEALPALVARVSLTLTALHTDVSLVMSK